jgi:hypothetical protein
MEIKTNQYRVSERWDVPRDSEPRFEVGGYVRAIAQDRGTGIVLRVDHSNALDEKTRQVHFQRGYTVRWLDQNKGELITVEVEDSLAPSARGVPKFNSPEEAAAWMEGAVQSGQWVNAVQDAADTAGDFDVQLQKWLEADDHPNPE